MVAQVSEGDVLSPGSSVWLTSGEGSERQSVPARVAAAGPRALELHVPQTGISVNLLQPGMSVQIGLADGRHHDLSILWLDLWPTPLVMLEAPRSQGGPPRRRAGRRIATPNLTGRVLVPSGTGKRGHAVHIRDLSLGGAQLLATRALPIHAEIGLSLPLAQPDGRQESFISATVVWTQALSRCHLAGVAFSHLTPDLNGAISRALLSHRFASVTGV